MQACDALAFAESLSHYERALKLVETVPDADALARRAAGPAAAAGRPRWPAWPHSRTEPPS